MKRQVIKRSLASVLSLMMIFTSGTPMSYASGFPNKTSKDTAIYIKNAKVNETEKKTISKLDFSSKEIIIGTSNENLIMETDKISDKGNGVYVLTYESEELAKKAYSYYKGKADFVTPNLIVKAAEGSEKAGIAEVGTPLDSLEEQIEGATTNTEGTVIAVIDSGMPETDHVTNRVSVIGDVVDDENGHGTNTMNSIMSVNADAKILSIKALDKNGNGDATSIYAGIEYAIKSGAKIIVLPIYAYSVADNEAISTAVEEAIASGITVVGAAGNDSANVKYYVPGNIEKAYIVGACDEKGNKIESSNYGATVDYNVLANSTSEASAKFAAFLSKVDGKYEDALKKETEKQTLIFNVKDTNKADTSNKAETPEKIRESYGEDTTKTAIVRYTFVDQSKLTENDDWHSIMDGDRDKILTTSVTSSKIYKSKDGTYKICADVPWSNGVACGKSIGWTFANGNDNGETIKDGVSYNTETNIATISENALSKADGDFSNIQMQVLVPTTYDAISTYDFIIENSNGKIASTKLSSKLFSSASATLLVDGKDGKLTKDDLKVYINNIKYDEEYFSFNEETKTLILDSLPATIDTIKVVINKDVKTMFKGAWADEFANWGNNTNGNRIAFYLENNTDVSGLYKGRTWVGDCLIGGSTGYPASVGVRGIEYVGNIRTKTPGASQAYESNSLINGYIGIPMNAFDMSNFRFFNPDGTTILGNWSDSKRGDQPMVNIGVAAYCVHEDRNVEQLTGWSLGQKKLILKILDDPVTVGDTTYYTLGYETQDGLTTGDANTYQNMGGNIRFAVKKVTQPPTYHYYFGAYKRNNNTGGALSGAHFNFYKYSGVLPSRAELLKRTPIAQADSNTSGQALVDIGTTNPGNVCVIETIAPTGFAINTQVLPVNVSQLASGVQYSSFVTVNDNSFQICIKKSSANTKITTGNKCYDLKGTTYHLKSGTWEADLVLDSNGNSQWITGMPAGNLTYYETKSGKGYKLDNTKHTVNVGLLPGQTQYTLNVKDEPGTDPLALTLEKKVDAKDSSLTSAKVPTLAGTQFQVDYYDSLDITDEQIKTAVPHDSYVFETKEVKGKTLLDFGDSSYLVKVLKGEANYYDSVRITYPYGTVRITEIKPATGFHNNPEFNLSGFKYDNQLIIRLNTDGTERTIDGRKAFSASAEYTAEVTDSVVPILETTLKSSNSDHIAAPKKDTVLTDTITIKNCDSIIGDEITIDGYLADSDNNVIKDADGNAVKTKQNFTINKDKVYTDKDGNICFDANVTFKFNAEGFTNKKVVAIQRLINVTEPGKNTITEDTNNEKISFEAQHNDLTSVEQSVYFPEIGTTLTDKTNGTHISDANSEMVLTDKVEYKNLQPEKSYTMTGKLMNAKTNTVVKDKDGKEVTATTKFTTPKAANGEQTVSGSVNVEFKFYMSEVDKKEAQKYVAFEEIPGYATHTDINDENQTIYVPHVSTVATNNIDGSKALTLTSDNVITDKVSVTGLKPGTTDTLKLIATIYDQKTGSQLFNASGNAISAEKTFITTSGSAEVEIKISVDAKNLKTKDKDGNLTDYDAEDKTIIVFESLDNESGKSLGGHKVLNDNEQAVRFPSAHTTATENIVNGTHFLSAVGTVSIKDVVKYTSLKPNTEYSVTGTLMDKKTGESIKGIDGKEITVSKKFKTGKANTPLVEGGNSNLVSGSVEVIFNVPSILLAGKTTVAFEKIYDSEREVVIHADINDLEQTDYIPDGHTTLLYAPSGKQGKHYANPTKDTVLVDTVAYSNLQPESNFAVTGFLVRAAETDAEKKNPDVVDENGQPAMYIVDADGNKVTNTVEFTTPAAKDEEKTVSGSVTVEFKFNASNLAGKKVVAFEDLKQNDRSIFIHQDLADENQSLRFPNVTTIATNKDNNSKAMYLTKDAVIKDTVKVTNISADAGKIKLTAAIYDQETGEQLFDGKGNPITEIKEFTLSGGGDTEQTIEIPVDVTNLTTVSGKYNAEGKDVVVTETLTFDDYVANEHIVLTDKDQTVRFPSAHTTATDTNGSHYISTAKPVVIKDLVKYTGLIPNKTYKIQGTLMDKKTGKAIIGNDGKEIIVTKEFTTAKGSGAGSVDGLVNGEVEVVFNVPAEVMKGKTTVAFEKIYDSEREVVIHADINDLEQTDYTPDGHTTLVDTKTNEHIANADKNTKLVDTVTYENMKPNTSCVVEGTLVDRATGKAIVDANGKEVTATKKFTTPAAKEGENTVSGTVKVTFSFDASKLDNTTVVAFETLSDGIDVLFEHKDLNDTAQTLHFPGGHTQIEDSQTKTTITSSVSENITLVDHVFYDRLLPEKTYEIKGTLMDKSTGKALIIDGKEVTAETKFTTPAAKTGEDIVSGVADVIFTFKGGNALAGKTLVAAEKCSYQGIDVFVNSSIDDKAETTYIPKGHTTVVDDKTKGQTAKAEKEMSITDTFLYENLKSNGEYRIVGTLMDKKTNAPLLIDGKEITSTKTFKVAAKGDNLEYPDAVSGKIDVNFKFDGSALKGHTLVVYEKLYYGETEIGSEEDINNLSQTIYIPGGHTNAYDSETKTRITNADESVKIIDTVTYENLKPNTKYTVNGVLMDKETNAPLIIDNKKVTSTKTFITPAAKDGEKTVSGKVNVTFIFNGINLGKRTIVAFEELKKDGISVWVHHDIEDKDETIYTAIGNTTLVEDKSNDHMSNATGVISLTDTLYYDGLLEKTNYEVIGTLYSKKTGKPVMSDGKKVTNTVKFTTPAATDGTEVVTGTVNVTFKFAGYEELKDDDLVAFETVKLASNSAIVFEHKDINDVSQTVFIPGGHTTATDSETNDHISLPDEEVTINDKVEYTNLLPEKTYEIKGTLMDKETGKALIIDGKEVTATKKFTTPAAKEGENTVSGSEIVTFKFNASTLTSKTIVVFEDMYKDGVKVFVHADINDIPQTVFFPGGHTTAINDKTKDQTAKAEKEMSITDTFFYQNLRTGKEYRLVGTLMDKETGKALIIDGKEVTVTKMFKVEDIGKDAADGEINIKFSFDGSTLKGHTLVVYEKLYIGETLICAEEDINNADQSIYIPGGSTTLVNTKSRTHIASAIGKINLTDTITYKGLLANTEYEVVGTLYSKKTRKPILVDGKEVTATKKFTTPAAKEGENTVSGTVDVAFEFEGYKELENDDLVAFETVKLASNSEEVFEHNDINDISQTVVIPELHTSVYDKSDRDKEIVATGIVTLIDEISYKNLIAGKKYIIEGIIMDKETGKALMIDGKEVTATATFIADKTNGTTSVEFNFDALKVKPGEYVVFETVKDEETKIVVAEHKDIEDKDQTFTVKSVQVPPTITKAPPTIIKTPKTGDSFVIMPIILIALAIVSIFISLRLKMTYDEIYQSIGNDIKISAEPVEPDDITETLNEEI